MSDNADAFQFIGEIAEELSIAPAELLGRLADLRLAASRRDIVAMRAALRELRDTGAGIYAALALAESIADRLAPELRVA